MTSNTLLESYKLGDLTLSNKFIMASLTRMRADPKTGVPNDLHVEYYSQRASASLILTECSQISAEGSSFGGAPGIYSKEQVEGWKRVNDAVHAKGGKIFIQIWHAGRAAHRSVTGVQPMAPSPIAIREIYRAGVNHEEPREMTKDDIKLVLEQFRQGAVNAKEAGFDGIELHGANGYLVDQFLRNSSNQRNDEYGGSVENRSRFCLEAIDNLIEVFGAKRVGIKLSPVGRFQDQTDSDPFALYSYLLSELDKRGIAYVQFRDPEAANPPDSVRGLGAEQLSNLCKVFRPYFKNGALMINENFTPEAAEKSLNEDVGDLACFGKLFISNPDLVERVRNGWPLNEWDVKTFYAPGEKGYTDYPIYDPKNPVVFKVQA